MAYSYQGTLSVSDSHQGTLSVSDDSSSGLVGELNYGVQSLSPVSTSDYNTLTNKPRINNVELVGNITTERLGIRNGEDGFSPVISERETELGYDITITDVEGSNTITLKNGTNGLDGTNGQDGKSAYEIAVDNGFVGTETEWLESLKGQDGIVMDAPSDGKVYGRMNANWVEVTDSGGGITDAPADSKAYARKDNAWVETVEAVNVYTKTEANEAFLPKTTVIPTKTSELINDSGFITSIPEEYVTNTEMTAYAQPKGDYALKSELFSKSYNDLTDKPTIPTKTSELTNDSGFITTVTVDNILSTTSENPVQNKVITEELNKKIDSSIKGVANGVAELDSNGKVLTAQLPSYVDDVLEYSGTSDFPTEGETGKIYVDTTTNKTYRWSGSTYIEISASLALGETSSTAYRGDRGKIAYDHSQSAHAPANAEANVQADWNETDTTSDAYILNKPIALPADGGDADTLDGKHASDFVDVNDTSTQIEIPSDTNNPIDVPSWIVNNAKRYTRYFTNSSNGHTNVPNNSEDWVWYYFDGVNIIAREHITDNVWTAAVINESFTGWKLINSSNADTVDGKHADDFIPATIGLNFNSSAKDYAETYKSGAENIEFTWRGYGATDAPDSDGDWFFHAYRGDSNWIRIVAFDIRHTASYEIAKTGGSWGDWKKLADGGNAATLESHPASDFALKTDIPTSLPANGGNADTLDGMHASDITLSFVNKYKPLVISVAPTSNSVIFGWLPVDGATKYAVSRYDPTTRKYITISTEITNTNYTVTGLSSDTAYQFLVQAQVNNQWSTFTTSDHIITNTLPDYAALEARVAALEGGTT